MKNYLLICVVLFFGLLVVTKDASACAQHEPTHSISSCCDQTDKTEEHNCCQTETSSDQDYSRHCDGKCNGTSCQQSSLKFQLFFAITKMYQWSCFPNVKSSFYSDDNRTISGFISIWLPPKIG